jgi:hypothetical protein
MREPQGSPPPGSNKNAPVTTMTTPLPPAVDPEVYAVLSMLKSTMTDPLMPVERVKQAYDLYTETMANRARIAYDRAMIEMQPKLPILEREGDGVNNRKYGRWEDIVEQIRPILHQHGFALNFTSKDPPPGEMKVPITAILRHKDGHQETASYSYPFDLSDDKTEIHAINSATSYGKRYLGCTILNIVTKGEDDDGKSAQKTKGLFGRQPMPPPGPPPPPAAPPPAAAPPASTKPVPVQGKGKKGVPAVDKQAVERAQIGSLKTQLEGAKTQQAVDTIAEAFFPDIEKMSEAGQKTANEMILAAGKGSKAA